METIKDILREMREKAARMVAWEDVITYGYTGPYFEQDVRRVTIDDLADRLAAANKREIAEAEARGLEAGALVEGSRHGDIEKGEHHD